MNKLFIVKEVYPWISPAILLVVTEFPFTLSEGPCLGSMWTENPFDVPRYKHSPCTKPSVTSKVSKCCGREHALPLWKEALGQRKNCFSWEGNVSQQKRHKMARIQSNKERSTCCAWIMHCPYLKDPCPLPSPPVLRAGVIRGVSLLWQPFGTYHISRHRSTAPNSPDLNPSPDLVCMWITWGPGKRRFWFSWSGVGCDVTAFLMSCQMMPWTKLWVPRSCRTIQGNLYLGFCTLRFLPRPRLPIQLWSQPIYPS